MGSGNGLESDQTISRSSIWEVIGGAVVKGFLVVTVKCVS